MSPGPTIPIARPVLGEPEAHAVRRVLLSGWITQGPEVRAFETEFAAFVGATHACAVANCTAALHLALLAVGVGRGDEVVTVSHSYIATANSIRYCGASPVFVDIDPHTFNLDPGALEAAITPRTRAIVCVHQMGMPCDLAAILPIARRRRLAVIEDAACAAGSEIRWSGRWERIGKPHADIACFSFHPRKVISTGDGGMLTTANADWDKRFRLLRQHAMSVPDTVRHASKAVIFESYPETGYNYRMTDLQAAVGRVQLERLPGLIRRRRELASGYRALLIGIDGLVLPADAPWTRSNWQSYCVRLPRQLGQRDAMERLLALGIQTRRGIMCSHREPAYAPLGAALRLPHSESAQDRCLLLPLHAEMTDADQERVCAALRQLCRRRAVRSEVKGANLSYATVEVPMRSASTGRGDE